MRKTLLIYLYASSILWVATIVATVAGGALYQNKLLLGTIGFGVVMAVVSLGLLTRMNSSGELKHWFKTQDELDKMLGEARVSWERANDISKIIGVHESVKIVAIRNGGSKYIKNYYSYKGKPYALVGESKIKQPDGEWVPCCIYVALYDCPDGKIWVRYKNQFYSQFNKVNDGTFDTAGY